LYQLCCKGEKHGVILKGDCGWRVFEDRELRRIFIFERERERK
jgi:hypothetical protein